MSTKMNDFIVYFNVFQNLPFGLLALCHTALKPENKTKNRYADIIACKFNILVNFKSRSGFLGFLLYLANC